MVRLIARAKQGKVRKGMTEGGIKKKRAAGTRQTRQPNTKHPRRLVGTTGDAGRQAASQPVSHVRVGTSYLRTKHPGGGIVLLLDGGRAGDGLQVVDEVHALVPQGACWLVGRDRVSD